MKRLFIILFATLFAVGCNDDKTDDGAQPTNGEVTVSADKLLFFASGDPLEAEQGALQITSSDKWRLSGKKTWCRPSAIEGQGGETITFEVDPNPDSEARSITYSLICGSKTQKVIVTQQASSVLDFKTPMTIDVAVGGGQISVITISTDDMTYRVADADKSWIQPVVSRAVQTNFLSFTVSSNPNFASRTGSIIFNVDGKEQTVTVNQAQKDKVSIPVTDYPVDPDGDRVTVNYTANVEIVPVLTEYPWITLVANNASMALSPGTLVFDVEPAKKTRMAQIPIKSADGLTTYATLTFSQAAAPVTTFVPDAKFSAWLLAQGYVTALAETNKFELTANGLAVSSFNVASKGIKSLEGIEAFETLSSLNCSKNLLSSLDLNANTKLSILNCEENNITMLNLTGCAKFATIGTSESSSLRITKNNLEEIYLPDACDFRLTVAGADRLKGVSGVASTSLKISAKGIVAVLCGLTGSLVTVDISECIKCVEFKGGTSGPMKTVYVNATQKELANTEGISKWQIVSGGQFVVK